MLYKIFRSLFYYATTGYFRQIEVKGRENIPAKGPVIFAVNHVSAFMDPIVLAVLAPRTMYFLTRGESFNNPFSRFLFKNLNMIPLYRPETVPGEVYKNKEVFDMCYAHLARGRCLMIFPEGNSKTERRLRPIKSGTARIALGANAAAKHNIDVKIIPVGINYSNPHRFQSDLYISIGKPISSAAYQHLADENEKQAVNQLTESIENGMKEQLVIINDEALVGLVQSVERIYGNELMPLHKKEGEKVFVMSRDIAEATEYFYHNDADRVWRVNLMIQQYNYHLARFGLRDEWLKGKGEAFNFWKLGLFFVLLFPLFFAGWLGNYMPYQVASFLIKKIRPREDFEGSIKLAVGMFTFLVWYVAVAVLVAQTTNAWLGVVTAVSLYPLGLFTSHYLKKYFRVKGTIRYLLVFLKKGKIVARLMQERQVIIRELEAARKEYFSRVKKSQPL